MALPEKKPGLLLVLEKGKKKAPTGDEPGDETDDTDPLAVSEEQVDAAREFHEAKTDEDRAKALKAFVKLCDINEEYGP